MLEDVGLVLALVHQLDAHTRVQERQLAQPLGQDLVVELDVREDPRARLEANDGSTLLGVTHDRERGRRLAEVVLLAVNLPVAGNGELEVVGEGVDDGDADAMQAARNLVGGVVEFPAGVQHGHDDLSCRSPFLRMDVYRDSTAVI